MNPLVRLGNGMLDRAADGLKALTMQFQRSLSWMLLPRTRYNYGADMGQGLGSSLVVATVGWTARNFIQAPLRLRVKKSTNGKVALDDVEESLTGPGAMLRLWETPNPFYDGATMTKALVADYKTTGNAYLVKLRNGSGRVVELWWVPTVLIEPKWPQDDPTVFLSHYEYNPNGTPIKIKPEDVIHWRDGFDPKNPRKGFNKLASLAREVFTDDEASNFSAAVLANMGIPGVIISPKDTGIASKNRIDDPEGVKESYMEKFGGDKRGEPMILTSPTEVQVLSWNPQQLTLKELRRLPEERVTAVLGTPAIVAGLGAGLDRSTFANFAEAREAGWEEDVIPTQGDLARTLRRSLLNEFVGDVYSYVVDFDPSEVRVLQEDQNKLVERATNALVRGGIPRRRFKEIIGEETDNTDDVYYIPTTVTVVNSKEVPPPLEAQLEARVEEEASARAEELRRETEPVTPQQPPTNGSRPVPTPA